MFQASKDAQEAAKEKSKDNGSESELSAPSVLYSIADSQKTESSKPDTDGGDDQKVNVVPAWE